MELKQFISEERVTIEKIEKIHHIWCITPENGNRFIFIPESLCSLNQPPRNWWPWKKQTLSIKTFCDQIFYAQIDNVKLFELTEANISAQKKEAFSKLWRNKLAAKEYNEKLSFKLEQYIKNQVRYFDNFEEMIDVLPILMRGYIKLHFYPNENNPWELKKIYLMYKLFKIADKIFKRRVELNTPTMAYNHFVITDFPHYIENPWALKKENFDIFDKKSMELVEEINRLLRKELPQTENERIYSYFNYEVRNILRLYTRDINVLNELGIKPNIITSSDYKTHYRDMTLLRYTNLFTETIEEKSIENFISTYVI